MGDRPMQSDLPCASYIADMLVFFDALLAVDHDGNGREHHGLQKQEMIDEQGKRTRKLKGNGKKDQQLQEEDHFRRGWRPSLARQLRQMSSLK